VTTTRCLRINFDFRSVWLARSNVLPNGVALSRSGIVSKPGVHSLGIKWTKLDGFSGAAPAKDEESAMDLARDGGNRVRCKHLDAVDDRCEGAVGNAILGSGMPLASRTASRILPEVS